MDMSKISFSSIIRVFVFVVVVFMAGCVGGSGNSANHNITAADAGPNQNVVVGSLVAMDGSKSTGADGSQITYQWSMVSKPPGSASIINNPMAVNPTFTPDLPGQYILKLIVTDTKSITSEATVTITASIGNAAPVANAGTSQSVATGAVVTLDGSASSDANGDPLTYSWAFTSMPAGSGAALSSATVVNPTFTADVAGAYVLNLVVNDGKVNSAPATVTVTAFVEYVAFGSSTTEGYGDDYPLDDTSLDERNTGGGFEPILNDLLASATGISCSILNEGYGGYNTTDALDVLPTVLANHPDATYYLILFGSNDAGQNLPSGLGLNPGDPGYSGSYKDNMQRMIFAIVAAEKIPYLAKLAYTLDAARNTNILLYNQVIDELVVSNGISVTPPDLYSWFQAHPEQLSDTLHPNGIGYQWIAKFWEDALVPVP
jgi:lysophospholipase L1-like esterase